MALNIELARQFNDALQYVNQSDRDQDAWYWDCRAEIFDWLDGCFLLMRDESVAEDEAALAAIVVSARKFFRNMYRRWLNRHIAIVEEQLAYEAAYVPWRKRAPAKWRDVRQQGARR